MHLSRSILSAALACLGCFVIPRAHAIAPFSGQLESFYDSTFKAPVHVQAEIVARPALQFGPFGYCIGEAVVRASFAGEEVLPVGQRFRFSAECPGTWFLNPGRSRPLRLDPPWFSIYEDQLRRGKLLELYLTPASPDLSNSIFRIVGSGLRVIPSLSAVPQFTPQSPRGSFYDMQYLPDLATLKPVPFRTRPRPGGEVILFPVRDVIVTYRSSAEPGREFIAAYNAAMQRVAMQPTGRPLGSSDRQIMDFHARMVTQVWTSAREFSIRMGRPGERVGGASSNSEGETVKAEGRDSVAGHSCTIYRVTPGRVGVQSGVAEALVCITDDGLSLRRVEGSVVTEATRVNYEPVDPGISVIPDGFKQIPAEDDVAAPRR